MADGLDRVAFGDVAELRWQVGTFGFHLASLEVRQHTAVHQAALAAVRDGAAGSTELSAGVSLDEYLRSEALAGLGTRLIELYPDEQTRSQQAARYRERLELEIGTIINSSVH